MQNVRFMGELTKFKIAPAHVTFHYLKCLLDDFSPASIDLLCVYLENCGRFLYMSEESSPRMANYVNYFSLHRTAGNSFAQENCLKFRQQIELIDR
jgi:regulator of nonsense transcripts 2